MIGHACLQAHNSKLAAAMVHIVIGYKVEQPQPICHHRQRASDHGQHATSVESH